MADNSKKIGFILRILRKTLLYYGFIDESVYMNSYVKDRWTSFIKWFLEVLVNGILWFAVVYPMYLLIHNPTLKYFLIGIVSFGTLSFLLKDTYAELRKKRGG